MGNRQPRLRLLDHDRDRQRHNRVEGFGGLLQDLATERGFDDILPQLRVDVARGHIELYSAAVDRNVPAHIERGDLASLPAEPIGKVDELIDECQGRDGGLICSLERDRPVGSASRALREQLRPRAD